MFFHNIKPPITLLKQLVKKVNKIMKKPTPKTELDKNIWSWVEWLWKEKNFQIQEELADYIGIHSHYLSPLKTGRRSFGPKWIRLLAERLNISQEQLMCGVDGENKLQLEEPEDLKEQLRQWKEIAKNWERQYNELKTRYDELTD